MGEGRPDDPWAPGSDASFERIPIEPFDAGPEGVAGVVPGGDPPVTRDPRRRLFVAAAVTAVVATFAGVVVLGIGDDESGTAPASSAAPVPESLPAPERTLDDVERDQAQRDDGDDVVLGVGDVPLGAGDRACLPERLPRSVEQRWAVDVGVSGAWVVTREVAAGLAFVVTRRAAPDGGANGASDGGVEGPRVVDEVVALDVVDGSERWRADVVGLADETIRVRDAIDDVVVVESSTVVADVRVLDDPALPGSGTTVIALSSDTGEQLWRRRFEPGVRVEVDPVGSQLVTHRETDPDARPPPEVAAIDALSGETRWTYSGVLGDVGDDGSVAVIDHDGSTLRWDGEVTGRFDLVGLDGASAVVVGSTLVVADGPSLTAITRGDDDGFESRPLRLTGSAGIDPPAVDERLTLGSLGDTSFVVEADGVTYGANLSMDTAELRWRRAGAVRGSEPSDRGRTLLVERDGAIVVDIVDASTGRTIAQTDVGSPPASLHANGASLTEFGDTFGSETVRALDLDGRERWTLPGVQFPAVGDRVVVEIAPDPERADVLVVSAFGAVADGEPDCGVTMREWVTS